MAQPDDEKNICHGSTRKNTERCLSRHSCLPVLPWR